MIELFGSGTIGMLDENIRRYNAKRPFIVTGKTSYVKSGAKDAIEKLEYDAIIYDDFQKNPRLEDVKRGMALIDDADVIISIGGGSSTDMAKLINALQYAKDPEAMILGDEKIRKKGLPHIAIPTTSGAGSQSTHFAVVYINKVKYSLAHETILPDVSIIDPDLTMELPKRITAVTGMDALTQAIESYWCINSTDESKEYAKEAIELVMTNLEKAVNEPDIESRTAMSKAANLAGKAINISKTTASHSISYPLTSYFGVAHGHACALTIGQMLIYNSNVGEDSLDKRGPEYVRKTILDISHLLGGKDTSWCCKRISRI
jgi:alcohol dehydrogenase class IV